MGVIVGSPLATFIFSNKKDKNAQNRWAKLLRFKPECVIVTFTFFMVFCVLSLSQSYWKNNLSFAPYLQFCGLLVNPVLLFAASYLIGRKLNLESELRTIIFSLFLGICLGLIIWLSYYIPFQYIPLLEHVPDLENWRLGLVLGVMMNFASVSFSMLFTSFSAISIAYLKKSRDK